MFQVDSNNYVTAQNQFQTDMLNDANNVISDIRVNILAGSYHHVNYILMNANSILRRTERAKNKTRNALQRIGSSYVAALDIDLYFNGGKIKPVANVSDAIRRAGELVYPKLPEFNTEHVELVKLHDTLLHELNILNGYSSANIATECQNPNNAQFQNCLGDKIVAFNATGYEFYKKVRDGAKLSIHYLEKVDKTYDTFLADGIKDLTKDITLKMNQLAESVYVQGNTGQYILGFGKLHMQWTINNLIPSIDKLAADIESVHRRVEGYFASSPTAFSADVLRSRIIKLDVSVQINVIIKKSPTNDVAAQINNTVYAIIDKSAKLFVKTIKTYDDSLDAIHHNSVNNKTSAEQIKTENSPSKFDKIDTAYFDCYSPASPTPYENLMTCISYKRYNVEKRLTMIKQFLETQFHDISLVSAVPFLKLQDQFVSYAEQELVAYSATLHRN